MVNTKTKEGIKNFEVVDGKTGKVGNMSGRRPRQVALKAATRGMVDIRVREKGRRNADGSKTIHIFNGSVKKVKAPAGYKFADKDGMINQSKVSKVGVERVK